MAEHTRPGDVLAGRYRLSDLLTESEGGRFWRAFDSVLQRDVAVHIIASDDQRAPLLRAAARTSATVLDRRMLRVLDIDEAAHRCFVVNEWGSGTSVDHLLAEVGPLSPTVAAWIVAEVGDTLALAHEAGVAHGRLVPENVLIDHDGAVRLIGFAVDAALHGLPPGRISSDVVDLVGLLYAALTGRWAGVSRSAVPSAPSQHGAVLRPRQVRAGIPRALDSLCDRVLNHGGDDLSAATVSDTLREFLGANARAAEVWLARLEHPPAGESTRVLAPLPDPPVRERDGVAVEPAPQAIPGDDPGDPDDPHDAGDSASTADEGLPTQAGLPIFHEDDEVTWLAKRTEAAPPPPPLDPPPERPLFAPDPVDGQPARRPRVATLAPHGSSGFWPWESGTGTGAGTGSGALPPYVDDDDGDRDDERPGVNQLRLAAIIAACLLVLIGCVIAFNLGRGRTPLGTLPSGTRSSPSRSPSTAAATPVPLTGVTARDFDPQGNPPSENPAQAPLAVDGDPATAWSTMTYTQNFGPGGLKTGVGLVLDLHGSHTVDAVDLTMVGAPTSVRIFVTDRNPTSLQGLSPAGGTTLTGTRGTVRLPSSPTGRYVVVWLTSLPATAGGFRGQVAEAVVRGA